MPHPLVLQSTTVVSADPPLTTPSVDVVALHVVAVAVIPPVLVDGRPT